MSKKNGFLWGAIVGSVVGSVTALLLAPKPGKELRQDIAEGARQVSDKTQEVAGKVGEHSSQLFEKVKDTAGGIINDLQAWRTGKDDSEEEEQAHISAIDSEQEDIEIQAELISVYSDGSKE